MNQSSKKTITVVGSGLAGTLQAIFLARSGYQVQLFEGRPDLRKENISAGKSINLAISERGLYALRKAGIEEAVLKEALPMRGRIIHDRLGEQKYQPYSSDPNEFIRAISRGDLNKVLLDFAEREEGISLKFNERLLHFDITNQELHFINTQTKQKSTLSAPHVIGADGAFSEVRYALQRTPLFSYSQTYLQHGYKELVLPAKADGGYALEQNALHIWPRKSFMLIALPNPDGSFTCTLFLAHQGNPSFLALKTGEDVRNFFNEEFADVARLFPDLEREFLENPTGSLCTIRAYPWNLEDKAVLVGDAAHGIVPFYGQGMNAAFESVLSLDQEIENYPDDFATAFKNFGQKRKKDADAIADLAVDNFMEMRDLVGTEEFLFLKQIEGELARRYPNDYIPKYTLVTFRRVPYSFAYECGKIQDLFLREIAKNKKSVVEIDWQQVAQSMKEFYLPKVDALKLDFA